MRKICTLLVLSALCGTLQAQCPTDHALDFDPASPSDYVESTNAPVTGNDPDFTIEARFKCESPTGGVYRRLFSLGGSATQFELCESNGYLRFVWNAVIYPTTTPPPSLFIKDGNWHHVAAVRNGTGFLIYIDGALVFTSPTSLPALNISRFRLGAFWNGVTAVTSWDGLIDEVRVWSDVRTPAEINAYRNCPLPTCSESGLLLYYKFNQGIAGGANNTPAPGVNSLLDCTSNSNHGAVKDFALTGSKSNWLCGDAQFGTTCCPADFSWTSDSCGHVQFTNLTQQPAPPPYTYAWDFNNDGTTDSNAASPSWNFSTSGTYTVCLSLMNSAGQLFCKTCKTVSVLNVSGPPIIVSCPPNVTINCNQIYSTLPPEMIPNKCANGQSLQPDHAINATFPLGTTVVTWTATNQFGSSTCTNTVTVFDNDIPIPLSAVLPDLVDSCGSLIVVAPAAIDHCNSNIGIIYGTPSAPVGTFLNTNPPSYQFGPGNYVITWVYDDGNGNIITQPQNVSVLTDHVPPVAICQNLTVSLIGSDLYMPAYWLNNGSYDVCCGFIQSLQFPGGLDYEVLDCTDACSSSQEFTLVVTDCVGNTSTCTAQVTVVDDTPPVAICHSSVHIEAGYNYIHPDIVDNGSFDNCYFTKMLSPDIAGCAEACKGPQLVTLTVTDCAGNSATCTSLVTATDTVPPTLICPSDVFSAAEPGTCGAVVIVDVPFATDNCSLDLVYTLSGATNGGVFDTGGPKYFNVGVTVVTFTGTDDCGNSATCTFLVTVEDHEPPIAIDCPQDISVTGSLAAGGANVSWAEPIFLDNCSPVMWSSSHTSGDFFPCGTTVVTYFASDDSGNTTTCSFAVTVDCSPDACQCGSFTNLTFSPQGTAPQSVTCGQFIDVPCPVTGTTFVLSGNFSCVGDTNCLPSNIQLVNSSGTPIGSGILTGTSFTWSFSGNQIDNPGWYELYLRGNCGQQLCECIVRFVVQECGDTLCQDFNDGNLGGWEGNKQYPSTTLGATVTTTFPGPSGLSTDICLKGEDESGGSRVINGTDYSGDWTQHYGDCFCFDVKIQNDGAGGLLPLYPVMVLYNNPNPLYQDSPDYSPLQQAFFVSNYFITETSGWLRVCAPIGPCDASGNLPSNANGYWVLLGSGGCADWNTLLQNVTHVGLAIDYHSSPSEVIHWDNICFAPCDSLVNSIDCDSVMVMAEADQDANGNCCWSVDLKNNSGLTDISSVLFQIVSTDTGINFSNENTAGGFNFFDYNPKRVLVTHGSGSIPPGFSNDAFSFCISDITSSTPMPIMITASWNQSIVGDTTQYRLCTDTFYVECEPPVFCDIISATAVDDTTHTGCCYELQINNGQPNYFTAVEVSVVSGGALDNADDAPGWSLQNPGAATALYYPTGSSTIPTGSQIVGNFCFKNLTADEQIIEIKYYGLDDSVVCRDTLKVKCDACVQAVVDSVYCEGWNHYVVNLCIQAGENLESPAGSATLVPLGGVLFSVDAPNINNADGSVVVSLPDLQPGESACDIVVHISGATAGQIVCFYAIIHDGDIPAGEPDGFCCADTVPVCFPMPACDPCDSTVTYATAMQVQHSDDSCCWKITLHNPPNYYIGVSTAIITPGVAFSVIDNFPPTSGWFINTAYPYTNVAWDPAFSQGNFVADGQMLSVVCFEGDAPGPWEMAVTWYAADSTECYDTLSFPCAPPDSSKCVRLDSAEIVCLGNGTYIYNFTVTNVSDDPAITGDHIVIGQVSPSGPPRFDPTVHWGTLPPGASASYSAMVDGAPGETICFVIALHDVNDDSLHLNCCNSDTFCIVLPPCGQGLDCEQNIVQNGDFQQGTVTGDLDGVGNVDFWTYVTYSTPQVTTDEGCAQNGSVLMWGNQVVGEGISQVVNFQQGYLYDLSLCAAWIDQVQPNVRIRVRATNGDIIAQNDYFNCTLPNCEEIFLTPILTTSWQTYVAPTWIPQNNYNRLVLTVWNNSNIDDGLQVSWARVDDICIEETQLPIQFGVRAFPNPTSGDLTLAFDRAAPAGATLRVFDMFGRLVKTERVAEAQLQHELSLNGLPVGVYFVEIGDSGTRLWGQRIVKK